jgi:hypothetical protein
MPLFRSRDKSAPGAATNGNFFGTPELQKKRYEAAMEFLALLQRKYLSKDGKAHAGTVLSSAAWLAGTSLYRSLGYQADPPAGTLMLSDQVNEKWPVLLNVFLYYCQKNGFDLKPDQLDLKAGPEHQPHEEIEKVQAQFQDQYNEIMKKHGLDYWNGALAGMIVCAIVFHYHCQVTRDIEPGTAAGIVSVGVVAGAKTVPPPLGSGGPVKQDRLVLGERHVVIRETQEHGGLFIDPNPQVLALLRQKNVDPYQIYEKALQQQIQAKIPRIDFVHADVDKQFDEWKGKNEAQAPIHVRLILWLKNNAAAHGYEQNGNSWILKS